GGQRSKAGGGDEQRGQRPHEQVGKGSVHGLVSRQQPTHRPRPRGLPARTPFVPPDSASSPQPAPGGRLSAPNWASASQPAPGGRLSAPNSASAPQPAPGGRPSAPNSASA